MERRIFDLGSGEIRQRQQHSYSCGSNMDSRPGRLKL